MQDFTQEPNPTEALKASFRRHASGVCVITTTDSEGNPVGFTATSMTSLGANPPLATFNVARGASSWPAISEAKYVAIHTLADRNLDLAKRMAADHTQRFLPQDWHRGQFNLPVFDDATSVLIAKVRDVHFVENNAVVIVDVVSGLLGEPGSSLLYSQRAYFTPGIQLEQN
jgi:flavin reductase (DIM6/NTAB) family NADH-FMN oxidoreductase RutF